MAVQCASSILTIFFFLQEQHLLYLPTVRFLPLLPVSYTLYLVTKDGHSGPSSLPPASPVLSPKLQPTFCIEYAMSAL